MNSNDMEICTCSKFGKDASPYILARSGEIEIIGEDPLEYDALNDFVNSSLFVVVKCTSCGKKYKVNMKSGYRVSYFNWERM